MPGALTHAAPEAETYNQQDQDQEYKESKTPACSATSAKCHLNSLLSQVKKVIDNNIIRKVCKSVLALTVKLKAWQLGQDFNSKKAGVTGLIGIGFISGFFIKVFVKIY